MLISDSGMDHVNRRLEGPWCILESECYSDETEQSLVGRKVSLDEMGLLYLHLLVTAATSESREDWEFF